MKLITKKPWWWGITGVPWGSHAMTWGNNVYCAENKVTPRILRHEACHVKQHRGSWFIALYHFIRSNLSKKYYDKMENEAKLCE